MGYVILLWHSLSLPYNYLLNPVMLKQPVTNRGSILLGEMVAIKMALQYIVRCKAQGEGISKVHIFSDSQSAVGQLTLGWAANSHKTTVQEVIREKQKLEEKKITVEVSWSPGHADIKGNDYVDKLAKEAAQEAKDSEQLPAVISLGDVKSAAKESGRKSGRIRGICQTQAGIYIGLDKK